ncbi:MAG: hypothetical protein ACKO0M_17625 [Cyanobium sp.]
MSLAAPHSSEPPRPPLRDSSACLGRTCLSWEADGELKQNDVTLILERLCRVDAQACQALLDQS